MFRCQKCGQSSRQPFSLIQQARAVAYTNLIVSVDRKHEKQVNSTGWEIANEHKVCAACLDLSQNQARQLLQTGKKVWNTQQKKR